MRPLLVGEDNPHSTDPRAALFPRPRGGAGHRLCKILGMTGAEYLRAFERVNLCAGSWSEVEARWSAERIGLTHLRHGGQVVLLGAKAARAFRLKYVPFRRSRILPGILILPHPSGRCRTWNDVRNVTRARRAVRGILRTAKEER